MNHQFSVLREASLTDALDDPASVETTDDVVREEGVDETLYRMAPLEATRFKLL